VQVAHSRRGAQPHDTGMSAAARDLGLTREEVRRAQTIASLPNETNAAAVERGLDDNQSALMAAAKERTPASQVALLEGIAQRGRVAATPTTRPPT